jgi:beta-galactosidase
MIRELFNDGWTVAPKQQLFAAIMAAAPRQEVTLPHDAMRDLTRDPASPNGSHTGYYPSTHVVYEKTFEAPESWRDRRVALEFEGVYRDAMVYLNGNLIAQRPSGYAPFSAELAPYLKHGEVNRVRVECRANQDSRWYSGVGIYRNVHLVVGAEVHIALYGVVVTTPEVGDEWATVETRVTVINDSRRARTVVVRSRLLGPDGGVASETSCPVTTIPGEPATVRLRHWVPDPQLWDIDSPMLHRAETSLHEDETTLDTEVTEFGIRTISVDPRRGFRLNGRSLKLRGGCVHHDNGPLGASAIPRAEIRKAELLKAAGFNAVRSAHNPASPAFLSACDRVGLLVVNEFSDVWTTGKNSYDSALTFADWWERDLESLVASSQNHPAVIMYALGNEILEIGRPSANVWGRRLAERVRELDPTRPLTNAVNGLVSVLDSMVNAGDEAVPFDFNAVLSAEGSSNIAASETVTRLTAEAHSQVDIAGLNYGDSRYDLDAVSFADRIIVGSETFPGKLDHLWKLVLKHPQVIGDFAWTGWDHLGEAGTGRAWYADDPCPPVGMSSPYPWMASRSGTIDINGVRRPISFWREIVWNLRSEPYIAVHRPQGHGRELRRSRWAWDDVLSSWAWDVPDGTPVTVDVYADAEEVELVLNGSPVATAAIAPDAGGGVPAHVARFETTFRAGELVAVARRAGAEVGRTAVRSLTSEPRLRVRTERQKVEASSADLVFAHVELRDDAGTLAVERHDRIRVEVAGPGILVALSSAKPDDEEGFDGDSHHAFEGRLLAIVRPTGVGEIRIHATSSDAGDVMSAVTARPVKD